MLKAYYLRVFVLVLKAQYVFYCGSPETVYTLVIIADNADIVFSGRKKTNKDVLSMVGVLILIDHDIPELVCVILKHIVVIFKKLNRLYNHIVKIHRVRVFKTLLIYPVKLGDSLAPEIAARFRFVFSRRNKLVLC